MIPSARRAAVVASLGTLASVPALRVAHAGAPDAPACATARMGKRTSHAMAFDANAGRVVLFGGTTDDPGEPLARTLWSWDGLRWRCLASDGPPARADAFLAFDAARRRLVLFGGRQFLAEHGVRYLLDTWEWDGVRWTLADTAGPGPRIHGAAAYDPVRRAVVIHGGGDSTVVRHDTWEWTGTRWREIPLRVPSNGIGNSLLPITRRGLGLLLGLRDGAPECSGVRRAIIHEISGDSLVPVEAGGPPACFSPSTPAAATTTGVLLYAGWTPNRPAMSWTWRDGRWTPTDAPPPRRRGAAAAYDERRRRVVLFGGEDDTGLRGDTWEWDGSRWHQVVASDRASR